MIDIHGAGYENIPEARRGREQRQATRQVRNMNRDWQRAFGDIATGFIGAPGIPNYLQMMSPQMLQGVVPNQSMPGASGPFLDIEYKKGPWWTGKREWSAKGIPAQMFMPGMMPGMGGYQYNTGWNNYRTYPGEIIRTKTKVINSAADPARNNESVKINNLEKKPLTMAYMESMTRSADDREKQYLDALNNINDENVEVNDNLVYQGPYDESIYDSALDKWDVGYEGDNVMFNKAATSMLPESLQFMSPLLPGLTAEQADALETASYLKQYTKDGKTYEYVPNPYASGSTIPDIELRNEEDRLQNLYDLYRNIPTFTTNTQYQAGGLVANPQMDEYDNLQKFVYGGGDDMTISPIIAYDDNDIQSKNTDDPYMFKNGGLYKFDGTKNSQINTGIRANNPAPGWTWDEWEALPETTRNKISQTLEMQKTGFERNAGRTMQFGYPAYRTAPSVGQQILDMFRPIKRNPYTGKNYDFMWMSQQGPIRTTDGQIYQPPAGGMQGLPMASADKPGYMYDYKFEKGPWWSGKKTMTMTGRWVDPNNPANKNQFNEGKGPTLDAYTSKTDEAKESLKTNGYDLQMPYTVDTEGMSAKTKKDVKKGERKAMRNYEKLSKDEDLLNYLAELENRPIKLDLKNNEPTPPKNYDDMPMDPRIWSEMYTNPVIINPDTLEAEAVIPSAAVNEMPLKENISRRERLNNALSGSSKRAVRNYGPDVIKYNEADKKYKQAVSDWRNLPGKQENRYHDDNVVPVRNEYEQYDKSTDEYFQNTSNRDKRRNFRQWKRDALSQEAYGGYVPTEMAYGGYMPTFDPGGQFSGTGPFDPNTDTGIAGGGIGPCTEEQVKNAQPGDPCYNEAYIQSQNPQDFSVSFDVNKAKTLSTKNISNTGKAIATGIQKVGQAFENNYQDQYLAANTTSDNREPINELDYRGGYSGLNQRIMSKGQGAGATGFNSVVGEAAFVKRGGQIQYEKGGVYDLTQDEIGKILAAGGQIKFL
jgi:hypothetical protein